MFSMLFREDPEQGLFFFKKNMYTYIYIYIFFIASWLADGLLSYLLRSFIKFCHLFDCSMLIAYQLDWKR